MKWFGSNDGQFLADRRRNRTKSTLFLFIYHFIHEIKNQIKSNRTEYLITAFLSIKMAKSFSFPNRFNQNSTWHFSLHQPSTQPNWMLSTSPPVDTFGCRCLQTDKYWVGLEFINFIFICGNSARKSAIERAVLLSSSSTSSSSPLLSLSRSILTVLRIMRWKIASKGEEHISYLSQFIKRKTSISNSLRPEDTVTVVGERRTVEIRGYRLCLLYVNQFKWRMSALGGWPVCAPPIIYYFNTHIRSLEVSYFPESLTVKMLLDSLMEEWPWPCLKVSFNFEMSLTEFISSSSRNLCSNIN